MINLKWGGRKQTRGIACGRVLITRTPLSCSCLPGERFRRYLATLGIRRLDVGRGPRAPRCLGGGSLAGQLSLGKKKVSEALLSGNGPLGRLFIKQSV